MARTNTADAVKQLHDGLSKRRFKAVTLDNGVLSERFVDAEEFARLFDAEARKFERFHHVPFFQMAREGFRVLLEDRRIALAMVGARLPVSASEGDDFPALPSFDEELESSDEIPAEELDDDVDDEADDEEESIEEMEA